MSDETVKFVGAVTVILSDKLTPVTAIVCDVLFEPTVVALNNVVLVGLMAILGFETVPLKVTLNDVAPVALAAPVEAIASVSEVYEPNDNPAFNLTYTVVADTVPEVGDILTLLPKPDEEDVETSKLLVGITVIGLVKN